jgi:hypothetical protein
VLPTFAVIGAMKAGTTSISAALATHPDVFICTPKEPQFFTTRWDRGLAWYESLFDPAGGALARGDASTSYTDFPRKPLAAQRMAETVPDVKLVYIVRDPVERMRSHYRHRLADGNEMRPIGEALLDDRYLLRSAYGLQIEQYLACFPREQLLVLDGADLLSGGPSWSQLFTFIGVPSPPTPPSVPKANTSNARMNLTSSARSARHRLRRTGLYSYAPTPLRRLGRRLGQRKASSNDEATITPALRAEIEARLHEDMQRFAELTGVRLSVGSVGDAT